MGGAYQIKNGPSGLIAMALGLTPLSFRPIAYIGNKSIITSTHHTGQEFNHRSKPSQSLFMDILITCYKTE